MADAHLFLENLALVLCVAALTTVLFRTLRQPVIFGYLLEETGLWTSCWMFFLLLVGVCLAWMHYVIRKMMHEEVPVLMQQIESTQTAATG